MGDTSYRKIYQAYKAGERACLLGMPNIVPPGLNPLRKKAWHNGYNSAPKRQDRTKTENLNQHD